MAGILDGFNQFMFGQQQQQPHPGGLLGIFSDTLGNIAHPNREQQLFDRAMRMKALNLQERALEERPQIKEVEFDNGQKGLVQVTVGQPPKLIWPLQGGRATQAPAGSAPVPGVQPQSGAPANFPGLPPPPPGVNAREYRDTFTRKAAEEAAKTLYPPKMTPTEQKAVMDAENDVPRLNSTIKNVQDAMKLNPNVYSGVGAELRGWMGAKLPDALVPDWLADPKRGAATTEWWQLMGGEAIKSMSETLKGASTDFEMKKFLSIAADTAQPPDVRQRAMERFQALANEELALRQRRASQLRTGDYFKPGNDATAPRAGGPSMDTIKGARADQQGALAEAKALIAQHPDKREAIIQRLKQVGINPAGL